MKNIILEKIRKLDRKQISKWKIKLSGSETKLWPKILYVGKKSKFLGKYYFQVKRNPNSCEKSETVVEIKNCSEKSNFWSKCESLVKNLKVGNLVQN